jgi:ABC-type nitrate/sulfonate/bicarbonate transport system substrate-binding protein
MQRSARRNPSACLYLALIIAPLFLGTGDPHAAEKLTLGYAQGSGLWPFWVAIDGDYFKQNDLDVEAVMTGGSGVTMAGLISGDLIVSAGGSAAGVSLVGNGAPIILIGRCGRPPFTLVTSDPAVRTVRDLIGKVVTTGTGQSGDLVLRDILQRNGLKYSDLQYIYQADQQARYMAVLNKRAAASVISPPYDLMARKANLREIVDFNTVGSPLMTCGIWVRKNTVEQRASTLEKFMRAYAQAVARFHLDKTFTVRSFNKHTRNKDMELAEHTYRRQVDLVPRKPYVENESLRPLVDQAIETKPEMKNYLLSTFYDNRFVKKLDDSGFIDGLYK